MEKDERPFKATIYFTDGESPIVKHYQQSVIGNVYTDGTNRIDWDSPLKQAHAFAKKAMHDGASVRLHGGTTMYIPINRIKHILVEEDKNS